MIYTISKDLDLCVKLKLTVNQLFFLKLLVPDMSLEATERRKKSYALCLKFQNETKGVNTLEINDLVNRDIILDLNRKGESYYDCYEINPIFAPSFFRMNVEIVEELYDAYPNFFTNDRGQQFVAKSCTPADISVEYLKNINNDPVEHHKILADIAWAKNNGGILMGLKKFVACKFWLSIRELREKRGGTSKAVDVTIL
jgi:hypothetical protein